MTTDRMKVKGPTFLAWIGYLIGGLALMSLVAQITGFNNFRPLELGDVPFLAFGLLFGFVVMQWMARHTWAVEVTPEYVAYTNQWMPWRRTAWSQIRRVELDGNRAGYSLITHVAGRDKPIIIGMKAYGSEGRQVWNVIRRYAPEAVSKLEEFPSGSIR